MLPTEQELSEYLTTRKTETLLPSTLKTYGYGLRLAHRELPGTDSLDPVLVTSLRASLSTGRRNIFDSAWKYARIMQAEKGVTLIDPPPLPRVRVCHPLMDDVTRLSGMFNIDKMPTLTTSTVLRPAFGPADPTLLACVTRIHEFQTGRVSSLTGSEPLLVNGPKGTPMQTWRIEQVINSAQSVSDGPLERISPEIVSALSRAKVPGLFLRELMSALWYSRSHYKRGLKAKKELAEVLDSIRSNHFAGLVAHIQRHRTSLDTTPPLLW